MNEQLDKWCLENIIDAEYKSKDEQADKIKYYLLGVVSAFKDMRVKIAELRNQDAGNPNATHPTNQREAIDRDMLFNYGYDFFEQTKMTFTGVNGGKYIDKDTFDKFLNMIYNVFKQSFLMGDK